MPETNLPPLTGKATLDVSDFRKGIQNIQTDLRAVAELGKRVSTLKLTADLSAGRDVQRQVRAIRDAVQEAVPSDMQRRISDMFGGFSLGANAARQSASVFEAQAAAIRARIDELGRAVKITRANFQAGFGEASPEEVGQLTAEMARLQNELKVVGDTARREFGEYSREAQKVANANRLAETTAAAARGEITRLGLASQVKLGVGGALQAYGPQAGLAANGLFQFAQASDRARIAQGLFNTTIEKTGGTSEQAAQTLAQLQDTLGVSADQATEAVRGLLRQGYSLGQAYTALEGAGASALAAGRSAAEGMDAYVDAVTAGESARLNDIGISENLSAYYQKEAKARGTTVDAMTRQQKVQAELALVTAATGDEVGDLSALMGGLSGNVSGANRELGEASKELGEQLVPLATNGARALTRVLEVFTALPQPVQTTVTLLGASAVAVGVLAGPVSALARGYRTVIEGLRGLREVAGGVSAATKTTAGAGKDLAEAAGSNAQNTGALIEVAKVADGWYAGLNARLTTSVAAHLAAGGSANVMSRAFLAAIGNTVLFDTALGALTITAAATFAGVVALAAGVGLYSRKLIQETQAIYDEQDRGSEAAFGRLMARVQALRSSGTELGRAQARVLLLQQQLTDAQQGPLVGVNALTGERIYGKPDEARIRQLQQDLAATRVSVVTLYTEAQRRGEANIVLTEDQKKGVRDLRAELEGKAFELRLTGMSDMQADLARLGKEYEDLRVKFKAPFVVNGKLLDPAQTPALRDGLRELDAQQAAQAAALRKKYADEAVGTARDSALAAQRAEVDAMREGQAKKAAQRALEVEDVRREVVEKVRALADFPARQREVEEAGRRQVAALRGKWAQEDRQLAEQNASRVADAERLARDGVIAAMQEGAAKEHAQREAALADLQADIARRVKELSGYPDQQARVEEAGRAQVEALHAGWREADQRSAEETARTLLEAGRSARDAEIANIRDEGQRRAASRAAELSDLQRSLTERERQLAAFPDAQRQAEELGRRQIEALRVKWAQEDERDARERAGRIAKAWSGLADAQANAMKAAGDVRLAQYNLGVARQQGALTDNPQASLAVERRAVAERARLAEQAAQEGYQTEARRLQENLRERLSAEGLSASERSALWRTYYADVDALDSRYQADALGRLAAREEAERQNAEGARRARVEAARQPATASERRVSRLEAETGTTLSDAGLLALNRQISAEREKQLATLQAMLGPASGLTLTAQERQDIEDRIASLQQVQLKTQQDQIEQARALRQSTLDRLDAEARLAESVAGTEADRLRAQQQQLAVTQARVRELDSQIAAEGREQERNRLIGQRYTLLGQVADLQDKINSGPLDAEKRRLDLYAAQARAELALKGLSEDKVAQARLTTQIAARELLLANQRVAAARNELEMQAALQGQAQARLALVQAMGQEQEAVSVPNQAASSGNAAQERRQETLRRQLDLENSLQDAAEARARALLQISGLGEDVLSSAEAELAATRERLVLTGRQLGSGVDAEGQAQLLKERLTLLGQQAEQERKVLEARRAQRDLAEELRLAEGRLNRELAGGQLSQVAVSTQKVADARAALATAERGYAEARQDYERIPSSANAQRLRSATEGLTGAIRGQRDAISSLAGTYRSVISQMDGVREAGDRLKQVAYGDAGQPFDSRRERERLAALQLRRDAAQQELRAALTGGDQAAIQRAAEDLARQEERYRKQAELLDQKGVKFSRTGEQETRRLADEVDRLGISYDREAVLLGDRAQVADREAQAAQTFRSATDQFDTSTTALVRALEETVAQLGPALTQARLDAELKAALPGGAAPTPTFRPQLPESLERLDEVAGRLVSGLGSLAQGRLQMTAPLSAGELPPDLRRFLSAAVTAGVSAASLTPPATTPVHTTTITTEVGGITIYQLPGESADQVANRVIGKLEDRARRNGKRC